MKTNKFFYTLIGLFVAAISLQAQSASTQKTDTLQTIKLQVKGITCSGDLLMISDNVEKVDGVQKCDNVGKMSATSTFEIAFDPGKTSKAQIVKIIEDTPSCDRPREKPYKVKQ